MGYCVLCVEKCQNTEKLFRTVSKPGQVHAKRVNSVAPAQLLLKVETNIYTWIQSSSIEMEIMGFANDKF